MAGLGVPGGWGKQWQSVGLSSLLAAGLLCIDLACVGARAQELRLTGGQYWVVLASRQDRDEAIGIARYFAEARVIRSDNGWYAVVRGPEQVATIEAYRQSIPDWAPIPEDAYLSTGDRYVEQVWRPETPILAEGSFEGRETAKVNYGRLTVVISRSDTPLAAPNQDEATPHVTIRVDGRDVIAFEADADTHQEPRATASIVRLDPRTRLPQVVVTTFTGGAHCCTVTQIATAADNKVWQVLDGDTLDGEGYWFEDVDGDGAAELLSVDNSFLYRFSSYAESQPPLRIHRLAGTKLVDITRRPTSLHRIRQDLHTQEFAAGLAPDGWRSNGFLAGWVATKALLGELEDAWQRMLTHYERDGGFLYEECASGGDIRDCPSADVRKVSFPVSLRRHLANQGYADPPSRVVSTNREAAFSTAARDFNQLTLQQKHELQMLLSTTGYSVAVSVDRFAKRIFDSIVRFQSDNNLPATGRIDAALWARLRDQAAPVLRQWGLSPVYHPVTRTRLWVPAGLSLEQSRESFGPAFASNEYPILIMLAHFRGLSVTQAYRRYRSKLVRGKIEYELRRNDFFVVTARDQAIRSYSRFHAIPGGIVGFSLRWGDRPEMHGDRLSVIMSDLFRSTVALGLHMRPPQPPASTRRVPSARDHTPPPTSTPAGRQTAREEKPRPSGRGTGFAIASDRIITNHHVVENCRSVTVAFDDQIADARLIARDRNNDLALLAVDYPLTDIAVLRSDARLGETVAAFGFPLRGLLATGGNFTSGNITATEGLLDDSRYLQFSAPVQAGNSGGPLLDHSGNVVGVVTSKLNVLRLAEITQDVAQNVNFAIKTSVLEIFLRSHGVGYKSGERADPLDPADLATHAKRVSAAVQCN